LRLRRTNLSSFNTQSTASAMRTKKSPSGGKINKYLNSSVLFRVLTIALVFVIAFCSYKVADKEINDRLTAAFYDEITGGQGTIDDPTKSDYEDGTDTWITQLNTLDLDGYDPLDLSPLGVIDPERPDATIDPTDLETKLGYINRQKNIWELHDGVNSDICAWIYIPGLGVNLPVAVDSKQNDYYLNHRFDRVFANAGTLFMNPTSSINPIARNLIIHGHNMNNGTMFGNLQNYVKGTKAFYDSHRYIFLDTLYGSYRYEIFSVYITEATSGDYLTTGFTDSKTFMKYCEGLKNSGIYSTDLTFLPEDRILTLSTCYSANNKKRVVVHARLAYPDPNETVATTATPTPTQTVAPTPTPVKTGSVYAINLSDKTSALNLRKEANTTSLVIGRLSYGDKVTLLEDLGEWAKVRTVGNTDGYVLKKYLLPEDEFSWAIPTSKPTAKPTVAPTAAPTPTAAP